MDRGSIKCGVEPHSFSMNVLTVHKFMRLCRLWSWLISHHDAFLLQVLYSKKKFSFFLSLFSPVFFSDCHLNPRTSCSVWFSGDFVKLFLWLLHGPSPFQPFLRSQLCCFNFSSTKGYRASCGVWFCLSGGS